MVGPVDNVAREHAHGSRAQGVVGRYQDAADSGVSRLRICHWTLRLRCLKLSIKPTKRSPISGRRITLKVGAESPRDFLLPENILCSPLAWFATALQRLNSQGDVTGDVQLRQGDPTVITTQASKAHQKIWLFGHRYLVAGLQNCAMLRVCEILKSVDINIPKDVLRNCFDLTPAGSKLRSPALDYMAHQIARCRVSIASLCSVTAAPDTGGTEALSQTLNDYYRHFRDVDKEYPRYLKLMK